METKTKPINEMAFPVNHAAQLASEADDKVTLKAYVGMTKREYFAGLILANMEIKTSWSHNDKESNYDLEHYSWKAQEAVHIADALIYELNE